MISGGGGGNWRKSDPPADSPKDPFQIHIADKDTLNPRPFANRLQTSPATGKFGPSLAAIRARMGDPENGERIPIISGGRWGNRGQSIDPSDDSIQGRSTPIHPTLHPMALKAAHVSGWLKKRRHPTPGSWPSKWAPLISEKFPAFPGRSGAIAVNLPPTHTAIPRDLNADKSALYLELPCVSRVA